MASFFRSVLLILLSVCVSARLSEEFAPFTGCESAPLDIVVILSRTSGITRQQAFRALSLVNSLYSRSGCAGNNSIGYVAVPPVTNRGLFDLNDLNTQGMNPAPTISITGLHDAVLTDYQTTQPASASAVRDGFSAAAHLLRNSYRLGRRSVIVYVVAAAAVSLDDEVISTAAALQSRGTVITAVIHTFFPGSDNLLAAIVSAPASRNIFYAELPSTSLPYDLIPSFDPRSADCCLTPQVCVVSAGLQVRGFQRDSFSVSTPGDYVVAALRTGAIGNVEVVASIGLCVFDDVMGAGDETRRFQEDTTVNIDRSDPNKYYCVRGVTVRLVGKQQEFSIVTQSGSPGPTIGVKLGGTTLSPRRALRAPVSDTYLNMAWNFRPIAGTFVAGTRRAPPSMNVSDRVIPSYVGTFQVLDGGVRVLFDVQAHAITFSIIASADHTPYRTGLCGAPSSSEGRFANPRGDRERLIDGSIESETGTQLSLSSSGVVSTISSCPRSTKLYRTLDKTPAGIARLIAASRTTNVFDGVVHAALPSYSVRARSEIAETTQCTRALGSSSVLSSFCNGNARVRYNAPVFPVLRLAFELCRIRCLAPDTAAELDIEGAALPRSGATAFAFQRGAQNEVLNDLVSSSWCEENVCRSATMGNSLISGSVSAYPATWVNTGSLPRWFAIWKFDTRLVQSTGNGGTYFSRIGGMAPGGANAEAQVLAPVGGRYTFLARGQGICSYVEKPVQVNIRCQDTFMEVSASAAGQRSVDVESLENGGFPQISLMGKVSFPVPLETLPSPQVFWHVDIAEPRVPNTNMQWSIENPTSTIPLFQPFTHGRYVISMYAFDGCLVRSHSISINAICNGNCGPDVQIKQARSINWRGATTSVNNTWGTSTVTASVRSQDYYSTTWGTAAAKAVPPENETMMSEWSEARTLISYSDASVWRTFPDPMASGCPTEGVTLTRTTTLAPGAEICTMRVTWNQENATTYSRQGTIRDTATPCQLQVVSTSATGSGDEQAEVTVGLPGTWTADFGGLVNRRFSTCNPIEAPITERLPRLESAVYMAPKLPEAPEASRTGAWAHFARPPHKHYWSADTTGVTLGDSDVCGSDGWSGAVAIPGISSEGYFRVRFTVVMPRTNLTAPERWLSDQFVELQSGPFAVRQNDIPEANWTSVWGAAHYRSVADALTAEVKSFTSVVRGPISLRFFGRIGRSSAGSSVGMSPIRISFVEVAPIRVPDLRTCEGEYPLSIQIQSPCANVSDVVTVTAACGPAPLIELVSRDVNLRFDYTTETFPSFSVSTKEIQKPSIGNSAVGFGTDVNLPAGVVSVLDTVYRWDFGGCQNMAEPATTAVTGNYLNSYEIRCAPSTLAIPLESRVSTAVVSLTAHTACREASQSIRVHHHCEYPVMPPQVDVYVGVDASGVNAGVLLANGSTFTPSMFLGNRNLRIFFNARDQFQPDAAARLVSGYSLRWRSVQVSRPRGGFTTFSSSTATSFQTTDDVVPWNISAGTNAARSCGDVIAGAAAIGSSVGLWRFRAVWGDGCVQQTYEYHINVTCPSGFTANGTTDVNRGLIIQRSGFPGDSHISSLRRRRTYVLNLSTLIDFSYEGVQPDGSRTTVRIPDDQMRADVTFLHVATGGTGGRIRETGLTVGNLMVLIIGEYTLMGVWSAEVKFYHFSSPADTSCHTVVFNITVEECVPLSNNTITVNQTTIERDSKQMRVTLSMAPGGPLSNNATAFNGNISAMAAALQTGVFGLLPNITAGTVEADQGFNVTFPFTARYSLMDMRRAFSAVVFSSSWKRNFGVVSSSSIVTSFEPLTINVTYTPVPENTLGLAPTVVYTTQSRGQWLAPLSCVICGTRSAPSSTGCPARRPSCGPVSNETASWNRTVIDTVTTEFFPRAGSWNVVAEFVGACDSTVMLAVEVLCSAAANSALRVVASAHGGVMDPAVAVKTVDSIYGVDGPRTFSRVNLTGNLSTVWPERRSIVNRMYNWYVVAAPNSSMYSTSREFQGIMTETLSNYTTHTTTLTAGASGETWKQEYVVRSRAKTTNTRTHVRLLRSAEFHGVSSADSTDYDLMQSSFVPDVPGSYTILLVADDGCTVGTDTVTVTAVCGGAAFSPSWMMMSANQTNITVPLDTAGTTVLFNITPVSTSRFVSTHYEFEGVAESGPVNAIVSINDVRRSRQTPPRVLPMDPLGWETAATFTGVGTWKVTATVTDGCTRVVLPARYVTVTCASNVQAIVDAQPRVYNIDVAVSGSMEVLEGHVIVPVDQAALNTGGCHLNWDWSMHEYSQLRGGHAVFMEAGQRSVVYNAPAETSRNWSAGGILAWISFAIGGAIVVAIGTLFVVLLIIVRSTVVPSA